MREASEVVKAQILRSFTNREAELAEQNVNAPTSWAWSRGIILFPEGICPWCREAIRNKEIWKVEGRQIVGQWRIERGHIRRVRSGGGHPHANGTSICMGNVDGSAASALFLHMNPSSCYWDWGAGTGGERKPRGTFGTWLREQWGHDCPGHTHTSMANCQLVMCPARNWSGNTPGCECDCLCNPELNKPCGCRHEECRCEKRPARGSSAPPASEPPPEETTPVERCSSCGDVFGEEGPDRSNCCRDMCVVCHDGIGLEDDDDEDDEDTAEPDPEPEPDDDELANVFRREDSGVY
jgi:hypothetical protein